MKDKERIEYIKKTFHDLSKTNKRITLKQVIDASGVEDPECEIENLLRNGIIIRLKSGEFRWV